MNKKMTKLEDLNKTKQAIMNIALSLFCKQGFNETSVEAIVKKAKVSKGAYYHYFQSKDAILEEIVIEFIDQSAVAFENIANDKKLTALKKFQKIMKWPHDIASIKKLNLRKFIKLGQLITRIDSAKLFDKMQNYTAIKFSPFLLKIFEQGIEEKSFNITYPEETCKLYVEFMSSFKRRMLFEIKECKNNTDKVKLIYVKIKFLEYFMERILGLKKGSIKLTPQGMNIIKKMFIN